MWSGDAIRPLRRLRGWVWAPFRTPLAIFRPFILRNPLPHMRFPLCAPWSRFFSIPCGLFVRFQDKNRWFERFSPVHMHVRSFKWFGPATAPVSGLTDRTDRSGLVLITGAATAAAPSNSLAWWKLVGSTHVVVWSAVRDHGIQRLSNDSMNCYPSSGRGIASECKFGFSGGGGGIAPIQSQERALASFLARDETATQALPVLCASFVLVYVYATESVRETLMHMY